MTHYNANDVAKHAITGMFIQDATISDNTDLVAQLRQIAQDCAESMEYIADINEIYPFQVDSKSAGVSVIINIKPMTFDPVYRELTWWCTVIDASNLGVVSALPDDLRPGYIAALAHMTDAQRDMWCKVHGA